MYHALIEASLGNSTGNPGVSLWLPAPNLLKPVPANPQVKYHGYTGVFMGTGNGDGYHYTVHQAFCYVDREYHR